MQQYGNLPTVAVENKKPLIMMETNTASCGGFPGFSDTFGAALFGIDWALQMAYYNFSGAMMHLGGQNAYYNVCNFNPFFQCYADRLRPLPSRSHHLLDPSSVEQTGL